MTDDLDSFMRSADAYRRAMEAYRWPGVSARLGPMDPQKDPLTLDEWNPAQDAKPALTAQSGRAGIRFVEECNVYDADGTLLGFMTLSNVLTMPSWNIPVWLTPVYIRVSYTREDLVRMRGRGTQS
jgi:hypothetical protein